LSSRENYSSEPEEFIASLKEKIEELKSEITVLKHNNQYLEEQHRTDLQIIELYREFVHEEEKPELSDK